MILYVINPAYALDTLMCICFLKYQLNLYIFCVFRDYSRKKVIAMKKRLLNNYIILKYVHNDCPSQIPLIFLSSLLQGLLNTTSILMLKMIIDLLDSQYSVLVSIKVLLFCTLINSTIFAANSWIKHRIIPRNLHIIKTKMQIRIFDKINELDYVCFESPSHLDSIKQAYEQANQRVSELLELISSLITGIFNITSLFALLVSVTPITVLASILNVLISLHINVIIMKKQHDFYESEIPLRRRSEYIIQLGTKSDSAKEIRLFSGLNTAFRNMYQTIANSILKLTNDYSHAFLLGGNVIYICNQAVNIALIVYLIYGISQFRFSLGDFVASTNGAQQLTAQIITLVQVLPSLYKHGLYADKFISFMEKTSQIETSSSNLQLPDTFQVEFVHVFFKYEASSEYVLKDVCLTISTGEKVLVVGSNGSGKSTLIKLLARLYEPTEGYILINGIDYRRYNLKSLRDKMSFLFQDYVLYPFSVKENITLGKEKVDREQELINLLSYVGLDSAVAALPQKEDTAYSKLFVGEGAIFSGGQCQRLAIARVLYKESQILVLDEPSNSLDPVAEGQILDHILNHTKVKTVLIISHKLSIAPQMDKIVCMRNGQIISSGRHDVLIHECAYYKELSRDIQ